MKKIKYFIFTWFFVIIAVALQIALIALGIYSVIKFAKWCWTC